MILKTGWSHDCYVVGLLLLDGYVEDQMILRLLASKECSFVVGTVALIETEVEKDKCVDLMVNSQLTVMLLQTIGIGIPQRMQVISRRFSFV